MRCKVVTTGVLVLLPWLAACPGDSSDDGESVTAHTAPGSQSGLDAPTPQTCEELGGTCDCAGSCNQGEMPVAEGSCPQPPDGSGACGQQCCVPIADTTAGTVGTAGSTAATADSTADTAPPVCDCALLPLCATPEGEDCNGQYPEAHCCDDMAAAMTCACIDPCDGGFPCCTVQPGCT
jgi:hypothetical protein